MWYAGWCALIRFYFQRVCGLRFRIYGKEYFPRSGGFILACNHASNLDPFLVGCICPRRLNYMAKEELFKNRFVGGLIASVGAFPVRRGAADLGAIRTAFKRVKSGGGLLLFPQGGRRAVNDTTDPEPGVGMLSQRMGVAVVPAFIEGSDKALPPGNGRIVRGTVITIRFGPAISLAPGKDYQETSNRIKSAIRSLAHG
jgi:1-acyl-sn-glycerol-3-phosphate acyltransferase